MVNYDSGGGVRYDSPDYTREIIQLDERLTETGIYNSYRAMMARCYQKNNEHYPSYGGRGIKVCEQWKSKPKNFIEWGLSHGWKEGLTIERKDVDGDYTPSNCKWIPRKEQSKNTQATNE